MELDKYIAEEIAKYKGICFPVKSSVLRRLVVRKERCNKLHPNPDDEFSMPEIGPSYRIISEYEKKFRTIALHPYSGMKEENDPIVIEKMHPEGYMIINGHHRWAAFLRLGYPKIPVKIVNLTHENDIAQMIKQGKHDKRVTLDFDEVVLGKEGVDPLEKKLMFPFNLEYKERLRAGIPALFNLMSKKGYDIWVYSANFYSLDYLQQLFRKYHVKVDGFVTGTAKKNNSSKEAKARIEKLISEKYRSTLHIDRDMVLQTFSGSKDFNEFTIDTTRTYWSDEVMTIVGKIEDEYQKQK